MALSSIVPQLWSSHTHTSLSRTARTRICLLHPQKLSLIPTLVAGMSPAAWASPRLLDPPPFSSALAVQAASPLDFASPRAGIKGSARFWPACVINKPPRAFFLTPCECTKGEGCWREGNERARPLVLKFDSRLPSPQRWIPVRYWNTEITPVLNPPESGVRSSGGGAAASRGWLRRGRKRAGAQLRQLAARGARVRPLGPAATPQMPGSV